MSRTSIFGIILAWIFGFGLAPLAASHFPELDQYLKDALSSNLQIKQTATLVDERKAAREESRANYFPTVDLTGRYTRAGGGRVIEIDPRKFLGNALPPGLSLGGPVKINFMLSKEQDTRFSLRQPLFTGGLISSSFHGADQNYLAAQAKLETARETVIYEVSEAYFLYLMAIELRTIAEDNSNLAEEHLKIVQALYSAERVALNDVYRAEVAVSSGRQAISESTTRETLAALYFIKLLNLPPDHKIKIGSQDSMHDTTQNPEQVGSDIDHYYGLAAENRPELKELKFNMGALDFLKKAYRAQYYPQLSLAADYGWEGETYNFDFQHDLWTISLFLNVNIFEGGAKKARLHQAEAQRNRLDYLYADLFRAIALEVSADYYQLANLIEKWTAAQDQLKSAQENFRITKIQFENGMNSQISYLDAQNELILARSNLVILYYEIMIAQAALDKACGMSPEGLAAAK